MYSNQRQGKNILFKYLLTSLVIIVWWDLGNTKKKQNAKIVKSKSS